MLPQPRDDDATTTQRLQRQLRALDWTCEGQDPETGAWRFHGPKGQHLIVPSTSQREAMRAVLWQIGNLHLHRD